VSTDTPHRIVNGKAVCDAPPGSFCRQECPEGTCEEWARTGCDHGPLKDAGHCLAAEWVNEAGLKDSGPDDAPENYEGLVDITWGSGGEGYTWAPATCQAVTD
jgi:hypothetical protein